MTWLTYSEAAKALRIEPASVKQRARRGRWNRQAGNDGLARIDVPDELIEAATTAPTSPPTTPVATPVADLIDRLRTDLAEALAGLAVARAELVRADELAADLRTDRDRWCDLASRPWWRRLVG
ncbi:hypothetical protein [Rhodoblastus sp.]|uniref:hypothetical protein n=1 Tax=Rhodoblastus sp. TaxID=1962975 RepID=UPI003F9EA16E